MKFSATLAIAFIVVTISLSAFTQAPSASTRGQREAMHMIAARGLLLQTLDAKKTRVGSEFRVKLSKTVHLDNGPELPGGTILVGNVVDDDMQLDGLSKLALRFTQATLKNGQLIPIKATIVGVASKENLEDQAFEDGYSDYEVPNSWTDGTLQVDQINAVSGVDLHSKITSRNSGVFVSKKKDDVKLPAGSEIQMAIAPGTTE
jgi:hypothetical protein